MLRTARRRDIIQCAYGGTLLARFSLEQVEPVNSQVHVVNSAVIAVLRWNVGGENGGAKGRKCEPPPG